MEESRSRGVNGTCEEHETVSEDIRCETQDGMAIDAGVLEIDSSGTIGAYNDLQLLKYVACEGFRQNNIESTEIRPGQGLAGTVMLERRILQINDAQILEKDKSFCDLQAT